MLAVILAGGLGKRLRPLTETIPKPMVPVRGKPFLEYELLLLKSHGISDFILCVGYLEDRIEGYFGAGEKLGIRIQYSHDGPDLLGPAGALKRSEKLLDQEVFFVTYGDAYLRMDYRRAMECFLDSEKLGMMTVYENKNRYGKSDLVVEDGYVIRYDKKNLVEGMNWINFGVSILRKQALRFIPENKVCDEEEFYGKLIDQRELLAYPVAERFYEIGNPGSLREFEQFISKNA